MAIALLLIERDDAHRTALCEMLAREHPSWRVAVAGSVAQAQGPLQQGAFDVASGGPTGCPTARPSICCRRWVRSRR